MRILVDCPDYKCGNNVGCVAMLQVTVRRLQALWPHSSIYVLTEDPAALAVHCPGTTPVPVNGRHLWFGDGILLGSLHRYIPDGASRSLAGFKRLIRRRAPRLLEAALRFKCRVRGADPGDLLSFLETVSAADAVVLCGAGGFTDHSARWTLRVFNLLEMAIDLGKPTAMFSHGLGPITNPTLVARGRKILSRVGLIALREGLRGRALAESLGISPDRLLVTGDDAIEPAYEARKGSLGTGLGINLRVSPSAKVGVTYIETIRPVLQGFAAKRGVPLVPVPICRGETFRPSGMHTLADTTTIERLRAGAENESDLGGNMDSPGIVIEQVGRCRVVVTGAYHAAVFALSQGIPAVVLSDSKSLYYMDKLTGLADQFGCGCEVVLLDMPDLPRRLTSAIDRAWQTAEDVRAPLLAAAGRQIEESEAAYRRFALISAQEPNSLLNSNTNSFEVRTHA